MLMRHFGGGIGHLSHVLREDSESSDSDSAMNTDSESNLPSAALEGEGGFENDSESDSASCSTSSESSLDDDSQESDLDSRDNGYDSL